MKYINFKSYKFASIFKKISLIFKNIPFYFRKVSIKSYNFLKIYKYLNNKINKLFLFLQSINLRRINFTKFYKLFLFLQSINLRKINFTKFYKNIDFKNFKYVPLFLLTVTALSTLIYLSIPKFYKYDKSNIENKLCKEINLKCSINGKVKYNIFPTPRFVFQNLIIKDITDKNKNFIKSNNVIVKLSFYNLLKKQKHRFKKIELLNSDINLDLEKIKKYGIFFEKKFSFIPILISNSKINLLEKNKYIAAIRNVKLTYDSKDNKSKTILNGDAVGDKIYVKYVNYKDKDSSEKNFEIKLIEQGILLKLNAPKNFTFNKIENGEILLKRGKNKLTGIFDYQDGKMIIKNSNLRNIFLDGKLSGEVDFLPFFNFNLNLDLNSLNFNRLFNLLINLSDDDKKNLFKTHKKINGNLNLSINKIFSKNTIIHSLESQTQFLNGNILFEKFLLNLGKLGAADLTGIIVNEGKFSNFRFEKNVYVDNTKRFFNKFGVYNRENKPDNFFISGNFDFINLVLRINEISSANNLKQEEVAYIEKEFNDFLLENGYESLFNFMNLKEFVKSISSEYE